ncbi:MAG: lactate racemase domain-containing protein [Lachnospiraceae bacterium]|nr:lactate racemase domain-containing protein [Lachnospiraceae bacterium]
MKNTHKEKIRAALAQHPHRKVLLITPDATRSHSYAGEITRFLWEMLKGKSEVVVMPALGTHKPMTERECKAFLGVPYHLIRHHDWRRDVEQIGEIPVDFFVNECYKLTEHGFFNKPLSVEVNRELLDPSYDLIISIGQVVPHEVAGMANYSKNIFVGVGGSHMIHGSHILGALSDIEKTMGRIDTPVRRLFDYAETHFAPRLPLLYIMTVTSQTKSGTVLEDLFIGREREVFTEAARLSQQRNITYLDKPLHRCIVNLAADEYKSTWLGNKAIYRTRMAMADGGEIIIIAPGIERFGEDEVIDKLIRRHGYSGREKIIELVTKYGQMRENLAAAAHLIHGSSEGRFTVIYATSHLSRAEIEAVGFRHMSIAEARRLEGDLTIDNPAAGLWVCGQML